MQAQMSEYTVLCPEFENFLWENFSTLAFWATTQFTVTAHESTTVSHIARTW